MFKVLRSQSTLFVGICAALFAVCATADSPKQIDVPAGDLVAALESISRQAGVELVFQPEQLKGLRTNGLSGVLTAQDAVKTLLEGTQLKLRTDDSSGAMMIGTAAVSESAMSANSGNESLHTVAANDQKAHELQKVQESATEKSTGDPSAVTQKDRQVQEIIVTAQKRSERLQDVPVPVTVINTRSLVNSNQLRLEDYYTRVPGFFAGPPAASSSQQLLSIRSITTGVTNPTVGVTIDDISYGSPLNIGGGNAIPDVDPGDLARIEVLRGPQGTLYGASSLGGLLKYVTIDPSLDGLSGRVQSGISDVHNGDGLEYNIRGAVNIPLSEVLAVRASAFTRHEPGYIDDPVHGREGVNASRVGGGRLAALWQASDDFSVKLSALLQERKGDGPSESDIALADLQQRRMLGTGASERKIQAYSATVNAKLGSVDLTALSGYSSNSYVDAFDGSLFYAGLVGPLFGATGAALISDNEADKFTQEIRFLVPIGERVEWLLGAYYADSDTDTTQTVTGNNAATGAQVGTLRATTSLTTYKEYAGFTNLTFKLTDRWDVQLGARQSEISTTYEQMQVTAPGSAPPLNIPKLESKPDSFTYLLTPRFRVSSGLMMYARVASGYRPGGPNSDAGSLGTPLSYDPDTTKSYEIGVKGNALDHVLSYDFSVYHIDWQDIQLQLLNLNNFRSYVDNGGGARSQGIELALESRPLTGMTVAISFAFSDAVLTDDLPNATPTSGRKGNGLPLAPRYSGSFSLDQDFPLAHGMTGFVGGSVSYVGERAGGIANIPTFLPSYVRLDLRAGMSYESWIANFFVNNVADKRGILGGGIVPPTWFYVQPRTVGFSLTKEF